MKIARKIPDVSVKRAGGPAPVGGSRRLPTTAARVGGVSERGPQFIRPVMVSPPPASHTEPVLTPNRSVRGALPARAVASPPAGSGGSAVAPRAPASSPGFHGAVSEFKRRLIERTLTELGGNRTRAARALGLQRTYLLRLMREFEVQVPASAGCPRRPPEAPGSPPPPG